MKNKNFLQATFPGIMLAAFLLTSCGTQNTQALTMAEEVQETDAAATNTEGSAQGDVSAQPEGGDTEEAAALTKRNELEWEQRLDYTTERQAQLAEITVALEQDTEDVKQKAQGLLESMDAGNVDAAVDNILAEDWYTVMLSDLLIGQRNYTGAAGSDGDWKMTILSDELGQHCTAIEYPLGDGRMFYVQVTAYEGEFSSDGKPTITTPANLNKEGKTAYASAKAGRTTYYLTVASDRIEDAFTPKQLGISNIWE